MARFGQIPPYGKRGFRWERLPYNAHYDPVWENRRYVLKADGHWFIRSDHTSHVWQIFKVTNHGFVAHGKPTRTLSEAMTRLLDGIAGGYYETT